MTSLNDAWITGPTLRRTALRLSRVDGLALVLLVVAGLVYCLNLTGNLLTDDEESYLYAAWRVSLGELPYRDFLTPQLPVFLGLGGLVMKLFGPTALAARLLSVGATLVAGLFVYLLGRRLWHRHVGLVALALYLTYPRVVDMARLYRPEALMLAAQVVALYLFVLAERRGSRRLLAASGAVFGLAMLCKLFGALPLVGVVGYMVWRWLRTRNLSPGPSPIKGGGPDTASVPHLAPPSLIGKGGGGLGPLSDLFVLCGMAELVVLGVMTLFQIVAPGTYAAVLGHHLMQGEGLNRGETVAKGLAFIIDYWWEYTAVVVLALAGAWVTLRRPTVRAVIAWQLPTVLVFLFLSRELFLRHMVYLAPAVCLLAAALLTPLLTRYRQARWRLIIAVTIVVSVLAPWLEDSWKDNSRVDAGTPLAVAYLDQTIPPGAPFVSDNAGLNFYTRRPTTPSAASLSQGATDSGQINAAKLLAEMDEMGVNWVLVARSGPSRTLDRLHDADRLRTYLDQYFVPVGTVDRERAQYTLLRRKG